MARRQVSSGGWINRVVGSQAGRTGLTSNAIIRPGSPGAPRRTLSFSASVPTVTRTQPARPSAEPGAYQHAAVAQRGDGRRPSSSSSGRRTQMKLASLSATHSPSSRTPSSEGVAGGDRRHHPPLDLILVAERLDRRRLGCRGQIERLAHLVDRGPEACRCRRARSRPAARRARRPSRRFAAAPGSDSG